MLLRFSRVRKIKHGRFPESPKLCDLEEKLLGASRTGQGTSESDPDVWLPSCRILMHGWQRSNCERLLSLEIRVWEEEVRGRD